MTKFRADPSPLKVDLGVGVFRDLAGNTPVLDCVRQAERAILNDQTSKTYVGPAGREEFNSAVEELVLGAAHPARRDRRTRTIQTPGGCGALRVGAELIRVASPRAAVHVSDPTWGNHIPLIGGSGLHLERYPYYDPTAHELRFAAMLDTLRQAAAGDVVLLHACCHNPTGADLDMSQWQELAALLANRGLVPFLDLAYQGFASSLDADAAGIRWVAEQVPEALIAVSYSKNLGLYRERVGALIAICENDDRAGAVMSQMQHIARSIYSMPPDHGAAIAAKIFGDPALRFGWTGELEAMRARIADMRLLLAAQLREMTGDGRFEFLAAQRGMFSLLGLAPEVVERLRERHHIYMTSDSRVNLAGIMPHNAAYVAEAVMSALSAKGTRGS